ncbi:MAG: hypothetical protein JNM00_05220 [Flavobacteriales bacterium]|nr:hypothetical protein [Flavobacteriales bacterium]
MQLKSLIPILLLMLVALHTGLATSVWNGIAVSIESVWDTDGEENKSSKGNKSFASEPEEWAHEKCTLQLLVQSDKTSVSLYSGGRCHYNSERVDSPPEAHSA